MSTDQNKAVYRRFLEQGFNQGRLDVVDEVLSPSYVNRDAPPGSPAGPEGVKQIINTFRAAFPDLQITIEELVAEGDKVCARSTMRGTHRGVLFGVAPTGRAVAMAGLTMVTVVDGRLVESYVRNDVAGLMSQIAAGAPAGSAKP